MPILETLETICAKLSKTEIGAITIQANIVLAKYSPKNYQRMDIQKIGNQE